MATPKGPTGKLSKRTRAQTDPQTRRQIDEAALDRFCENIAIDEMSFDSWENLGTPSKQPLDLTVPLFLSAAEAQAGGEKTVKFSRQVIPEDAGAGPVPRERDEQVVEVPSGAQDGHRLRVPGRGDRRGTAAGDLNVIIRIRRQP